ncbi:unnamed protein product [Arabidopsis lyrata]|uniref:Photosystem II reaction center protein Z n=1 Tax=Arabidopsis lyrata subsp. lyrata TaxID=81972 RepID=D7KV00_ARALL|nr:predicted protein [Arabidopsis lyrata subsp. lyrata]CAH8257318.1 unnamed protein product [Arabidopsis lyrata]
MVYILLLIAWRIKNMTIAFQLAVFALIITSSILCISVPVVFASPDGWSKQKCCFFLYIFMDWISLLGGYP